MQSSKRVLMQKIKIVFKRLLGFLYYHITLCQSHCNLAYLRKKMIDVLIFGIEVHIQQL